MDRLDEMQSPLVSIIIPVYNCENYLQECLQSVENQTYQNIEVVIIDDGSSDQSIQIIEGYVENDRRLRLLRMEKNGGVSGARNQGIEQSNGELLLFLDADDAIAPCYIESLVKEYLKTGAFLLGYPLLRVMNQDFRSVWTDVSVETCEEFTYYTQNEAREVFSKIGGMWDTAAIGGKLIARSAIGDLRFEQGILYGEDTLFLHRLMAVYENGEFAGTAFVRGSKSLYLYRIHENNAIKKKYTSNDLSYNDTFFHEAEQLMQQAAVPDVLSKEAWLRKREAAYCLELVMYQLEGKYSQSKQDGKKAVQNKFREMTGLKAFCTLSRARRLHIKLFIISPRGSILLKKCYDAIKYRMNNLKYLIKGRKHAVGILTFHCADNFGAMLQAYALKKAIGELHIPVEIVDYAPFYMTGRHFYIPYYPMGNLRKSYHMTRAGLQVNRKIGYRSYRECRKKMKHFRKEQVAPKGLPMRTLLGLKAARYGAYVVGSDQIWNPELTYGLRKAYFGPDKKAKTIAYAASFGGATLQEQYKERFSALSHTLSAISMREVSAVPYVEQFFPDNKNICAVCDPVFLLTPGAWFGVKEGETTLKGYILVHLTEPNAVVESYIKVLAERTGKKILRLKRVRGEDASDSIMYDVTAGPNAFLQYIYSADYVVTNSFHATALSIIYKKQIAIAGHTSRGARLYDLLDVTGLQDRMLQEENVQGFDIDQTIDWCNVSSVLAKLRDAGRAYISENLQEFIKK